jgi:hypothetical protein
MGVEENANYNILVARSKSEKEQFEIQMKKYISSHSARKNPKSASETQSCSDTSTPTLFSPEPSNLPMASMAPSTLKLPKISKKS